MEKFEEVLLNKYFSGIIFSDEMERQVFLSYIRGFSLLILDPSVMNILEIGGGQSTTLLAELGQRLGWKINTIDMNPDAITLKIRSQSISDATLENIHFRKGLSISTEEIRMFYNRDLFSIGGVTFEEMAKVVSTFVDTTLDARRAPLVAKVLGLDEFSMDAVVGKIFKLNRLTKGLIDIFRTPGDEFDYNIGRNEGLQGLLEEVMVGDNINVVFLDSGEFSSLPEWEIVAKHLRIGGYVILHDIFFPKSFKNWLVCSSIMANSAYKTMYIDRSTPQGLMVAQKIK